MNQFISLGKIYIEKNVKGNLSVLDPCSGPDVTLDALAGIYNVTSAYGPIMELKGLADDEGVPSIWGNRVKYLQIVHESITDPNSLRFDAVGTVCVDSGLAGFSDTETVDIGAIEQTYDDICDTCSDKAGATFGSRSVFSSTGYGDGGYTVWASKNSDGEVVAARIEYIEE
jgi:hypothetical protein